MASRTGWMMRLGLAAGLGLLGAAMLLPACGDGGAHAPAVAQDKKADPPKEGQKPKDGDKPKTEQPKTDQPKSEQPKEGDKAKGPEILPLSVGGKEFKLELALKNEVRM